MSIHWKLLHRKVSRAFPVCRVWPPEGFPTGMPAGKRVMACGNAKNSQMTGIKMMLLDRRELCMAARDLPAAWEERTKGR